MSVVKINAIEVPEGMAEAVEGRFAARGRRSKQDARLRSRAALRAELVSSTPTPSVGAGLNPTPHGAFKNT